MALRNIFKKSPTSENAKENKEIQTAKKEPEKNIEEKKVFASTEKIVKKAFSREAYTVLKSPHVSEKATDLTKKNQYVFNVWDDTTKSEVKKAVEGTYGVDVLSVNIVNIPRKKKRVGKTLGFKKGYKKAIVRIKEGQKIEIMPR